MYCVVCGKQCDNLFSGMCVDCFIERTHAVSFPEKVKMIVCAECGSVQFGKHWEQNIGNTEAIKKVLMKEIRYHRKVRCDAMKISCTDMDAHTKRCNVVLNVELEGISHSVEKEILVYISKGMCPNCSRLHGHAFSAIVQIRRKDRKIPQQYQAEIEEIINTKKNQIVKKVVVKNGIDYYIMDNAHAHGVCEQIKTKFNARLKISPRLHTRKDGKDVYRVTYLVELNRFDVGDLIYTHEELYLVVRETGDKVAVQSLKDASEKSIDMHLLEHAEQIELSELLAVDVIHVDASEITVMDPSTMKLLRFPILDYSRDDEKAWVLKREDNIYLIPLSAVKHMRESR